MEINAISRLFAQDPSMYIEIMLASEDRCLAIRKLADTYSRLARLVTQKNRLALNSEFATAHTAFREDFARAFEESNDNEYGSTIQTQCKGCE
jgi:prephenate dehydrogenase/chorismate mutase/prephenate dehydrogenase